MAKKHPLSKTQALQEYVKAHPRAKPAKIAAALAEQGVKITPAHVSQIKSKSRNRRPARREPLRTVVAKPAVGLPQIKAALALLKTCDGNLWAVKEAMAAAEELVNNFVPYDLKLSEARCAVTQYLYDGEGKLVSLKDV